MAGTKVEIELRRVQGFIFEVPRLKAMLGANALIGHTLRHELANLVGERGEGLSWPDELALTNRADDPLGNCGVDSDDPTALFARGILVRDGGRFIAAIKAEHAAEFVDDVTRLLAEALPGVKYDLYVDGVPAASAVTERHPVFLPVLQICDETGAQLASGKTGVSTEQRWASRSVQHRYAWGDKFRSSADETRDAVSLLRSRLYPQDRGWKTPSDLNELASGSYLALIHADGNRIGQRYADHMDTCTLSGMAREAYGEVFYHSMRVAVRRALIAAAEMTFSEVEGVRPFEVLMLGGDDLLLVCRAGHALKFAAAYAEALADPAHKLSDGRCLDVAIGVAIARSSYPIHRLHDLAEELASSAKRLYRAAAGGAGSVIDWQVVTQAYRGSISGARRDAECIRYLADQEEETLLLSRRPYKVSGPGGLSEMLAKADGLAGTALVDGLGETARSALRGLRRACESGYLSGQYTYNQLPQAVRQIFGGELWENVSNEGEERVFATRTLDIVDILEVGRLGKSGGLS